MRENESKRGRNRDYRRGSKKKEERLSRREKKEEVSEKIGE